MLYTKEEKRAWKLILECEDEIVICQKAILRLYDYIDHQHNILNICDHERENKLIEGHIRNMKKLGFLRESGFAMLECMSNEAFLRWN